MASRKKRAAQPIDPQVRMGHVHLKVADLEKAIGFYRDVLGFDLMQRMGGGGRVPPRADNTTTSL
jgi:catechol-2,3-dioxygenase